MNSIISKLDIHPLPPLTHSYSTDTITGKSSSHPLWALVKKIPIIIIISLAGNWAELSLLLTCLPIKTDLGCNSNLPSLF
jgi:hypothetical protein